MRVKYIFLIYEIIIGIYKKRASNDREPTWLKPPNGVIKTNVDVAVGESTIQLLHSSSFNGDHSTVQLLHKQRPLRMQILVTKDLALNGRKYLIIPSYKGGVALFSHFVGFIYMWDVSNIMR